jgi:hypothetical protein
MLTGSTVVDGLARFSFQKTDRSLHRFTGLCIRFRSEQDGRISEDTERERQSEMRRTEQDNFRIPCSLLQNNEEEEVIPGMPGSRVAVYMYIRGTRPRLEQSY